MAEEQFFDMASITNLFLYCIHTKKDKTMNRILILELTLIKDKYMVEKISTRCYLLFALEVYYKKIMETKTMSTKCNIF